MVGGGGGGVLATSSWWGTAKTIPYVVGIHIILVRHVANFERRNEHVKQFQQKSLASVARQGRLQRRDELWHVWAGSGQSNERLKGVLLVVLLSSSSVAFKGTKSLGPVGKGLDDGQLRVLTSSIAMYHVTSLPLPAS